MADHHDETPVGALREAVHDQTTMSIQQAAQGSADAAVRRWLPWTTALMCVVAALTSATVAVAVQHSVQLGAAEASAIDRREAVAQARGRGDSANAVLRARGQQVVQIPQLDVATESEVLVAAATARVLATLPDNDPTTEQLGEAVARVAAERPASGPSPQQLAEEVAGHLAANPAGRQGASDRTPTAAEISGAVAEYVRAHPDVLCPRGGQYGALRVQLSDHGSADTWACVVLVDPPATSTTNGGTP